MPPPLAAADLQVAGAALLAAAAAVVLWRRRRAARVPASPARAVLITGCDSGIGRAAALRLGAEGYGVIATCRERSSVELLNAEAGVTALQMDVTDDASVDQCRVAVEAELARRGGTLLAVVNNAGTALGTLADLTPVAAYETNMQVNFLGLVRVTRAFLPLLKAAAAAGAAPRLVNVSSPAGCIPLPTSSAYCASKAAVESYTRNLRWEVEPMWGVRIVTIRPGAFRTAIMRLVGEQQRATAADAADPERAKEYGDEFLATVRWYVALGQKYASDPCVAAAAIVHAATARRPSRSYLPGRDAVVWRALMWPVVQWIAFANFARMLPKPAALRRRGKGE